MNDHVDFERLVSGHIAAEGVTPPSDAFYDELFTRAGRSGQRPEWLALIKESPMRTNSHIAVGSPTVRVLAILAATLLLALALAAAGAGVQRLLAAGPIIVAQDGSGTVETISAAVAMAEDGDEVLVKPGIYSESVTVDKDITITGDGAVDEIVIAIADDAPTEIQVFGFTPRYAFYLDGADATVGNLTVTGERNNVSVFVVRGGNPTIHDVVANLGGSGGRPAAFVFMEAAGGAIRDSSTDLFLWVDGGSTPEIAGNVSTDIIRTNGPGTDPWVHDNVAVGIWAHHGSAPLVEDNDISGSTNPDCGIEAGDDGTRPIVRGNRVSGNGVGICAYRGGSITELIGNTVTNNDVGVRLDSPTDIVHQADNTICDNDQDLAIRGQASSENETCGGGGEG